MRSFMAFVLEQFPRVSPETADALLDYCAEEELEGPQDLALLLPVDASPMSAREVLGDAASDDTVFLLVAASRVARQGLSTWAHLQTRRLEQRHSASEGGTTQSSLSAGASAGVSAAPPICGRPSSSAIAAAKARLAKVLKPSVGKIRQCEVIVAALSLRSKIQKKDDVIINQYFALLYAIGDDSPRYCKSFAGGPPTDGMLKVQSDVFSNGHRTLSTVHLNRREAEACLSMAKVLGWSPYALTEWQVAAYLRDQRSRGKSVPARVFHALEWCESAFELTMHTRSPLVRSQRFCSASGAEAGHARLPAPAKCVTVDILLGMEELTFNAPTEPLMAWAGFHCLLGQGVLRFSDAQRCLSVRLTDDAIAEQPLAMKNHKAPSPVAALRIGWSGRDWASQFIRVLARHSLPGQDFLMLACSSDFKYFSNRIAGFQDAQIALRTLLQLSPISFSLRKRHCCIPSTAQLPALVRHGRASTQNEQRH